LSLVVLARGSSRGGPSLRRHCAVTLVTAVVRARPLFVSPERTTKEKQKREEKGDHRATHSAQARRLDWDPGCHCGRCRRLRGSVLGRRRWRGRLLIGRASSSRSGAPGQDVPGRRPVNSRLEDPIRLGLDGPHHRPGRGIVGAVGLAITLRARDRHSPDLTSPGRDSGTCTWMEITQERSCPNGQTMGESSHGA